MERKTGFEPATTTLARWGSTGLSYFRVFRAADGAKHSGDAAWLSIGPSASGLRKCMATPIMTPCVDTRASRGDA